MKSMRLALRVLGVFAVAVPGVMLAQPAVHFGGMPPLPVPPGVVLNDAQKAQVKALLHNDHAVDHERHQKLDALRHQIMDGLTVEGALDREHLAQLSAQEAALHAEEAQGRLAVQEKIHDLLTPEQQHQASVTAHKLHELHEQIDALTGRPPEPPVGEQP
ncbi:Spy/CpxP family protein refolding chaperone [Neokomagataea anthophila]|uniref:Spy/CpxP family protein refolding chaperone n=1 Tax=Neokomagataea anthophila TaxID=2826925 RepID=A0ABS5E5G2_9PROT|nr:Spy/CpxP family protein refolding chaperone [Neokomagataea anthophila]MBR0559147.1 Spy/CpxP family protein refolding chaperone [Neokomagataea anthophila]